MPTLKLTKPLIDDLKPQPTDQVYGTKVYGGSGRQITAISWADVRDLIETIMQRGAYAMAGRPCADTNMVLRLAASDPTVAEELAEHLYDFAFRDVARLETELAQSGCS
jgi:hypothetical protein